MRGVGQIDAIESVTFRHEEGNEGEKNGVKRGNAGFFGGKLLKRQGWILLQARSSEPNGKSIAILAAPKMRTIRCEQFLPLIALAGLQQRISLNLSLSLQFQI